MSTEESRGARPSIFRKEALEYQRQNVQKEGDVLHLSPLWVEWSYWVVVGLVGVALLFCVVGTVSEYASGPGVVRVEGDTNLTVAEAGVVVSVSVQPGQEVAASQTLVTLQATAEENVLERIRQEYELQLVRYMRDPSDQAARQSLTSLTAELDQARARMEARTIRAPFAGVLGDIRVRPGQYLVPGAHVVSLRRKDAPATLLAFLPGYYRPLLHHDMPLTVELEGFRNEYQTLHIESVGSQIIGPEELRRYLGPDLADAVPVQGPLVLVRASLPSRTFTSEERELEYFDGMPARVEVPVRSEPIWTLLLPGWKGRFAHGG